MSDTFKVIQLVGTSTEGYQAAIDSAIERAGSTLQGLEFFEVVEHRGHIRGPKLVHQVKILVGFKVQDVTG
ncbi:MAG: dodecin domain-containing protein [Thermoplasmata archaeon]|nr:MAG: dodecin domain-containing protein [Thermoplasmata archaeon]